MKTTSGEVYTIPVLGRSRNISSAKLFCATKRHERKTIIKTFFVFFCRQILFGGIFHQKERGKSAKIFPILYQ